MRTTAILYLVACAIKNSDEKLSNDQDISTSEGSCIVSQSQHEKELAQTFSSSSQSYHEMEGNGGCNGKMDEKIKTLNPVIQKRFWQ